MYQSFWVSAQDLESVKKEIRSLPSLRFKGDPIHCGNKVNLCLTGMVEDFNKLNERLEEASESGGEKELEKQSPLNELADLIFGKRK